MNACYRWHLIRVVIPCLTTVLLVGCSSNLTRNKAESLIKERSKFPINETTSFILFLPGSCSNGPCGPSDVPVHVKAAQDEGLLTVAFDGNELHVSLTEKGKQYAIGNVNEQPGPGGIRGPQQVTVIWKTLEFGEITGITQSDSSNDATVEYTVSQNLTPFGRFRQFMAQSTILPNLPNINMEVRLKKYDDGWRIINDPQAR